MDPRQVVKHLELVGAELVLQGGKDRLGAVGALVVDGDDLIDEGRVAEDGRAQEIRAVARAHEGRDAGPTLRDGEIAGRKE